MYIWKKTAVIMCRIFVTTVKNKRSLLLQGWFKSIDFDSDLEKYEWR